MRLRALVCLVLAIGFACGALEVYLEGAWLAIPAVVMLAAVVSACTAPIPGNLLEEAPSHNAMQDEASGENNAGASAAKRSDIAIACQLPSWNERIEALENARNLSKREREVLSYLARGRNAAFIQQELNISIHTVKTHMSNVYGKLGVHSIQEILDLVEGAEQHNDDAPAETQAFDAPHIADQPT